MKINKAIICIALLHTHYFITASELKSALWTYSINPNYLELKTILEHDSAYINENAAVSIKFYPHNTVENNQRMELSAKEMEVYYDNRALTRFILSNPKSTQRDAKNFLETSNPIEKEEDVIYASSNDFDTLSKQLINHSNVDSIKTSWNHFFGLSQMMFFVEKIIKKTNPNKPIPFEQPTTHRRTYTNFLKKEHYDMIIEFLLGEKDYNTFKKEILQSTGATPHVSPICLPSKKALLSAGTIAFIAAVLLWYNKAKLPAMNLNIPKNFAFLKR